MNWEPAYCKQNNNGENSSSRPGLLVHLYAFGIVCRICVADLDTAFPDDEEDEAVGDEDDDEWDEDEAQKVEVDHVFHADNEHKDTHFVLWPAQIPTKHGH